MKKKSDGFTNSTVGAEVHSSATNFNGMERLLGI